VFDDKLELLLGSILIVDDDEFIREKLKLDFRNIGLTNRLLEATNGVEGIEKLKQYFSSAQRVQLIICDYEMPDMNGIEFHQKVINHPEFSNIPFLMLTSHSERDFVLKAIQAGVSGYMVKPWNKEDLKQKLIQCIEKHQK
jgi:two-component system chemotaxis response regulator CheY